MRIKWRFRATRIICSFSDFLKVACVFHLYMVPSLACVANFPVRGTSFSPAGLTLHTAFGFLSFVLIRSLNPRIESPENWTKAPNRRLDGVGSLRSPPRPNPLVLPAIARAPVRVCCKIGAVNNLAGRERWGKSTNRRMGGSWGERGPVRKKRFRSFGKLF